MTPNVGAANLAIEDAVELATAIGTPEHAAMGALARYDALRLPRTTKLSALSRRAGAVAEWSTPIAVAARSMAVRLGGYVPSSVTARSIDRVLGWRPAPLTEQLGNLPS
jgi:2-polyprenyl-6-methoxyphenol hydroxylase-like FAD-dependent oxidoreductase